MRWSWVNLPCRGVLLVWIRVGQGPTVLAVGGGCLDIFTLIYPFSSLSPSLWETTRYRLKYCLKGSLSPKTTNQPKAQALEVYSAPSHHMTTPHINISSKNLLESEANYYKLARPSQQLFGIRLTTRLDSL